MLFVLWSRSASSSFSWSLRRHPSVSSQVRKSANSLLWARRVSMLSSMSTVYSPHTTGKVDSFERLRAICRTKCYELDTTQDSAARTREFLSLDCSDSTEPGMSDNAVESRCIPSIFAQRSGVCIQTLVGCARPIRKQAEPQDASQPISLFM